MLVPSMADSEHHKVTNERSTSTGCMYDVHWDGKSSHGYQNNAKSEIIHLNSVWHKEKAYSCSWPYLQFGAPISKPPRRYIHVHIHRHSLLPEPAQCNSETNVSSHTAKHTVEVHPSYHPQEKLAHPQTVGGFFGVSTFENFWICTTYIMNKQPISNQTFSFHVLVTIPKPTKTTCTHLCQPNKTHTTITNRPKWWNDALPGWKDWGINQNPRSQPCKYRHYCTGNLEHLTYFIWTSFVCVIYTRIYTAKKGKTRSCG